MHTLPADYATVRMIFLIGFAILLAGCLALCAQHTIQGVRGNKVSRVLAIGYIILSATSAWGVWDTWTVA